MKRLFADFDPRLLVAAAPVAEVSTALAPEEAEAVAQVSAVRRREFASGRVLARALLSELGAAHPVVPRCADRSPRWPEGFVGSIAHTDRTCVVAAGPASRFASLGVDVEPARPLESELFATIAGPSELVRILSADPARAGLLVRRLFVAKEAVYKCVYPLTGAFLEFHDVAIEVTADGRAFSVAVARHEARGIALAGRFAEEDGSLYALVVAPARSLARAG